MVYYNENDRFAAAWLKELRRADLIAGGRVDARSIEKVRAEDIADAKQVHLFAGIGGWSLALRLAGWPDDRPVWTGSCPCQPFSSAGKGGGESDARHLWPEMRRLIGECRPPVCFGEQVASKAGRLWLSRVRLDLEAMGYAVGAVDICAAGVGAPHIRQRLFWVANSDGGGSSAQGRYSGVSIGDGAAVGIPERRRVARGVAESRHQHAGRGAMRDESPGRGAFSKSARRGDDRGLVNSEVQRQRRVTGIESGEERAIAGRRENERVRIAGAGHASANDQSRVEGVDNPLNSGLEGQSGHDRQARGRSRRSGVADGPTPEAGDVGRVELAGGFRRPGRTRIEGRQAGRRVAAAGRGEGGGPWDDFRIVHCSDGKARRIESGLQPLAHRVPARVGRLRGYGNAIVPLLAAEFILAYREAIGDKDV